jgi:hypothetical protein
MRNDDEEISVGWLFDLGNEIIGFQFWLIKNQIKLGLIFGIENYN